MYSNICSNITYQCISWDETMETEPNENHNGARHTFCCTVQIVKCDVQNHYQMLFGPLINENVVKSSIKCG